MRAATGKHGVRACQPRVRCPGMPWGAPPGAPVRCTASSTPERTQAYAPPPMFFGRKNPFSATDAFPLSDAVMEFDDSASSVVRPARRAMDVVGPQGGRSAGQQWARALTLVGLYALVMAGFYGLGVV